MTHAKVRYIPQSIQVYYVPHMLLLLLNETFLTPLHFLLGDTVVLTIVFLKDNTASLFTETARKLKRSLVLLGDKAAAPQRHRLVPQAICRGGQETMFARRNAHRPPPYESTVFFRALSSLRASSEFLDFIETAEAIVPRLREELGTPTPGVTKQRETKNARYPLTKRVLPLLLPEGITWEAPPMPLWWPLGGATDTDSSRVEVDPEQLRCGVTVSALLALSAIAIDGYHSIPRAAQIICTGGTMERSAEADTVREWMRDGLPLQLQRLLRHYPPGAQEMVMHQVAHLLLAPPPMRERLPTIPAGPLLFPSVTGLLWCSSAGSRLADGYLQQLSQLSAQLIPSYFREDAAAFQAICSTFVRHVVALLAVAIRLGEEDDGIPALDSRRTTAALRDVINKSLEGLEMCVKGQTEVPLGTTGLSRTLFDYLIRPLCDSIQDIAWRWGKTSKQPPKQVDILLMTLRTATYRAWMVLEEVGRAELGRTGDAEHTASLSRKRNRHLLQQSGGRVTMNILRDAAEDHQLMVEETSTRSASGYKLFKLRAADATGVTTTVFVYIADGSIFFKVGRSPEFQMAKSVFDLFTPFNK
eukprot:gene12045-8297_t